MHRYYILVFIMASILACTYGCSARQAKHEGTEWSDIWIANANDNAQPRILLVGDSIVSGYYYATAKHLSGKASCAKYATSKFLANPDYLAELGLILKRYRFDVIHINNGLHGWGYTENEYKQGLQDLLKTLERHARQAKVIWCTTTPMRKAGNLSQLKKSTNDRVIERNRIATEIMNCNKISINNLYEEVKDHPEYFANDGVHYNDTGKAVQAKMVAQIIEKNLSNKPMAN